MTDDTLLMIAAIAESIAAVAATIATVCALCVIWLLRASRSAGLKAPFSEAILWQLGLFRLPRPRHRCQPGLGLPEHLTFPAPPQRHLSRPDPSGASAGAPQWTARQPVRKRTFGSYPSRAKSIVAR